MYFRCLFLSCKGLGMYGCFVLTTFFLSLSKWGYKTTFLKTLYRSFWSQKSDLVYMGKTPKIFKVVVFILRLSLVHKEKRDLDAKGFPLALLDYHYFKRIRRSWPKGLTSFKFHLLTNYHYLQSPLWTKISFAYISILGNARSLSMKT